MAAVAVLPLAQEPVGNLARRLADLIEGADQHPMPDAMRDQIAVRLDALRSRVVRKPERDHRSLFELDDRLIELMSQVEDATEAGTEITPELAQEIDTYFEAHRRKVDRIAGYWRWQQSIADICSKEAERLSARKRAAEIRVTRLKGFLMAFMTARAIKKLEGQKSEIATQRNSTASLVIDDLLQLPAELVERSIRFTKAELKEIASQLPEGHMRCRLDWTLKANDWEPNRESIRAALPMEHTIPGVRMVTGAHVRIR